MDPLDLAEGGSTAAGSGVESRAGREEGKMVREAAFIAGAAFAFAFECCNAERKRVFSWSFEWKREEARARWWW